MQEFLNGVNLYITFMRSETPRDAQQSYISWERWANTFPHYKIAARIAAKQVVEAFRDLSAD